MIKITIKPPVLGKTYKYTGEASKELLSQKITQRDIRILNDYKRCPYKKGDVVTYNTDDINDPHYNHKVQVVGIASNYIEYGKYTTWSDPPLIVSAFNLETQKSFICTVDSLRKV